MANSIRYGGDRPLQFIIGSRNWSLASHKSSISIDATNLVVDSSSPIGNLSDGSRSTYVRGTGIGPMTRNFLKVRFDLSQTDFASMTGKEISILAIESDLYYPVRSVALKSYTDSGFSLNEVVHTPSHTTVTTLASGERIFNIGGEARIDGKQQRGRMSELWESAITGNIISGLDGSRIFLNFEIGVTPDHPYIEIELRSGRSAFGVDGSFDNNIFDCAFTDPARTRRNHPNPPLHDTEYYNHSDQILRFSDPNTSGKGKKGLIYFMQSSGSGSANSIDFDGQQNIKIINGLINSVGLIALGTSIIASQNSGGGIYGLDTDGAYQNLIIAIADAPSSTGVAISNFNPSEQKIYWASQTNKTINKSDWNGENIEVIVTGLNNPWGIAWDNVNQKVYWCEFTDAEIKRCNSDGSSIETIVNTALTNPDSITVDNVNDKIYVTDSGSDRIKKYNLDGTGPSSIITGLTDPRGIAYNSVDDKIYWCEGGGTVKRANNDGTGVIVLASGQSGPRGICIRDMINGKQLVYFSDVVKSTVKRMDLDGSNLTGIIADVVVGRDIAVSVKDDLVFATDSNTDSILKCRTDGAFQEVLLTGLSNPEGIVINETEDKMYWAEPALGKITKANLDGTSQSIILPVENEPMILAMDETNAKIYWTDKTDDDVKRSNLDGTSKEVLISSGVTNATGIALDVPNNKMYIVHDSTSILRCNLDGSSPSDIITGLFLPHGIGVDTLNNKIYWTQVDGIFYADLDGTNQQTLDDTLLGDGPTGIQINPAADRYIELTTNGMARNQSTEWIPVGIFRDHQYVISYYNKMTGFTLKGAPFRIEMTVNSKPTEFTFLQEHIDIYYDQKTRSVYYLDANVRHVGKMHINTGQKEVLLNPTSSLFLGSITVNDDNIFWTAPDDQDIWKSNKDGTGEVMIVSNSGNPAGIDVHIDDNKLYWADIIAKKIYTSTYSGSSITEIMNLSPDIPYSVRVNESENKIYIAAEDKIIKANDNGSGKITIVTGLDGCRNLTIDKVNSKIYYTDYTGARLGKCNLDGTSNEIIDAGLGRIKSITNDRYNKVYFHFESWGRIDSMDVTDNDIRKVFQQGNQSIFDIYRDIGTQFSGAWGKNEIFIYRDRSTKELKLWFSQAKYTQIIDTSIHGEDINNIAIRFVVYEDPDFLFNPIIWQIDDMQLYSLNMPANPYEYTNIIVNNNTPLFYPKRDDLSGEVRVNRIGLFYYDVGLTEAKDVLTQMQDLGGETGFIVSMIENSPAGGSIMRNASGQVVGVYIPSSGLKRKMSLTLICPEKLKRFLKLLEESGDIFSLIDPQSDFSDYIQNFKATNWTAIDPKEPFDDRILATPQESLNLYIPSGAKYLWSATIQLEEV